MKVQMMKAALAISPAGAGTREAPAPDTEPGEVDAGKKLAPDRPKVWKRAWRTEACVPRLARLHAQTQLSVMSWSGNQIAGVRIVTEVVRNALDHAGTGKVELTLSVGEDDVLLIDVTDPAPGDETLDDVLASGDGTGLWLVRHLGGEVSWFPAASGIGKTIRVRMQPGEMRPTALAVEPT